MSVARKTNAQRNVRKEELVGVWYTTPQFPWVEVLWFKECTFQVTSHYGELFVVKGKNKLIRSLSDLVPELLKHVKKRVSKPVRFFLGNNNSRGLRLRNKKHVRGRLTEKELLVIKKAIKTYPQLFSTFLEKKCPLVIMVSNQRLIVDDPKLL